MGDWVGLGGKGEGANFVQKRRPVVLGGQYWVGQLGCTALAFHCIRVQRGIQKVY